MTLNLILTFLVVPVILATGCVIINRRVGNRPAMVGPMVTIATAVVIVLSVLVGAMLYSWQVRDYNDCRRSVTRSFGNRELQLRDLLRWHDVQTEIDTKSGGRIHLDALDAVVTEGQKDLDELLPMRSYSECKKPLTF